MYGAERFEAGNLLSALGSIRPGTGVTALADLVHIGTGDLITVLAGNGRFTLWREGIKPRPGYTSGVGESWFDFP
jgi:hypothetical protein